MDEAVRVQCPACGLDRIVWLPAAQEQARCPACGGAARLERPASGPPSAPAESPPWAFGPPDGPVSAPVPVPFGAGAFPRRRDVRPALVLLVLVLLAALCHAWVELRDPALVTPYGLFLSGADRVQWAGGGVPYAMLAEMAVLSVGAGYLALLLVWTYRTHRDLERVTGGRHKPSPGLAMGLLFVPIVHAFWLWYLLRRLSLRVGRVAPEPGEAEAARRPRPVGTAVLRVFLAAAVVEVLALPFKLVLAMNAAEGRLVGAFQIVQLGLMALKTVECFCLALGLYGLGEAVGEHTDRRVCDLLAGASAWPGPPRPPQPFRASPSGGGSL